MKGRSKISSGVGAGGGDGVEEGRLGRLREPRTKPQGLGVNIQGQPPSALSSSQRPIPQRSFPTALMAQKMEKGCCPSQGAFSEDGQFQGTVMITGHFAAGGIRWGS